LTRTSAAPAFQTVNCEVVEGLATIELNRPDSLNALDEKMAHELAEAIAWANNSDCRAVLLAAAGTAFCAGRDVSKVDPASDDAAGVLGGQMMPLVRAVRDLPVPTFAAVQGACLGVGLGLALACDVVYASEDARIGSPFNRLGAVLDSGGHALLMRRLGPGRTLELIYTGRLLDGRAAAAIGLVERAVPRPMLREFARAAAAKTAAGPTSAFKASKGIVRDLAEASLSLEQSLEAELAAQISASMTDDYREGFTAFLEKRKPSFSGR
jgi:2-(1,2-epoxy-1,2-dihydrophenyl)acetyl-CoA isomerase